MAKIDKPSMSAAQLTNLLEDRHLKDVFVPQCKMGASGSRILDGWALLPTWSPMTTIGYELKVSRSDWLQDQKFEEYRSAVHLFFVVAPKGVVQSGELPAGVGLLEPIGVGTGMRLVMRAKAVRQSPEPRAVSALMAHVLMWRKDEREAVNNRTRRADVWRAWLEERKEFRNIAAGVRGRMRTMLTEAIESARVAEARAERLSEAAEVLKELGVEPSWSRWATKRDVEAALREDAAATIGSLDTAMQQLGGLKVRLEQVSKDSAALLSDRQPVERRVENL